MAKKLTASQKASNEKIALETSNRIKRAYPIGQKVVVWRYTVGDKKVEWDGVVTKHYKKGIGISSAMGQPVKYKSKYEPFWRPSYGLQTTDSPSRNIRKSQ